jgi:hypothetical protein
MYAGHVNSVLHYLAYDDFVRNAGRVFRDKEFRELVQRRLGPPVDGRARQVPRRRRPREPSSDEDGAKQLSPG